jgi:hypothetical protein
MHSVYFIYKGNKIPKYALASIELAKQTSGMKIHLIGNSIFKKEVTKLKIEFTAIEDFYDQNKIDEAVNKNQNLDKSFRDGFWIKTLERLFILEQYMLKTNLQFIFHSEIDQLLFRSDKLVKAIIKTNKKGIFIPFHNKNMAIASVMFINKLSAIQSLIQFAFTSIVYSNEMELIAAWSKINPKKVFALPTLATEIKGISNVVPKGINTISVPELEGLVDAAQLGQWVGGIDPSNVPITITPANKFIYKPENCFLSEDNLKRIKLKLSQNNSFLEVQFEGRNFKIYNLHLHSKIHQNILSDNPSILSLMSLSNLSSKTSFKGTKFLQFQSYLFQFFTKKFFSYYFLKVKLKFLKKLKKNDNS